MRFHWQTSLASATRFVVFEVVVDAVTSLDWPRGFTGNKLPVAPVSVARVPCSNSFEHALLESRLRQSSVVVYLEIMTLRMLKHA